MDSKKLAQLRAEYQTLLASWDFAFAMGHGCSVGDHPEFKKIRERAADLKAILSEHE